MKMVRFDKLGPGRWAVRGRLEDMRTSKWLAGFHKLGEIRNDDDGVFRLYPIRSEEGGSACANNWDGSWGPITLAHIVAKLTALNLRIRAEEW